MKKTLFTLLLVFGLSTISLAQSDKMKEKINEKIEKLNQEIMDGDASQSLSESQKEEVFKIEFNKLKEVRAAKKANSSKEDIKAIHKKYGKILYQEILTKEQKKARKKGKAKE